MQLPLFDFRICTAWLVASARAWVKPYENNTKLLSAQACLKHPNRFDITATPRNTVTFQWTSNTRFSGTRSLARGNACQGWDTQPFHLILFELSNLKVTQPTTVLSGRRESYLNRMIWILTMLSLGAGTALMLWSWCLCPYTTISRPTPRCLPIRDWQNVISSCCSSRIRPLTSSSGSLS